jgi:hypothetical protein
MYSSIHDESTLVVRNHLIHSWPKAPSKAFGEQLPKTVDESNWAEVFEHGRGIVLSQQHHECVVE